MRTGPKYKIAKRLGPSVFEKTQSQKFAIAAERAERSRRGRRGGRSEYAKQILEKQKVRMTYGISEKQFRTYVHRALAHGAGEPVARLHELLEMRLDNVAYRLGLAPSRRAARQLIAHGHLTVNGKKVRVPSYPVTLTDRLAVRDGSKAHGGLVGYNERFMERPLPSWLSWNPKSMEGAVTERPTQASAAPAGDLAAVLSFYTR